MEKQRIQVYADAETKRRIKRAAARHNMPITEYCLSAIQQQLDDDELLGVEGPKVTSSPSKQTNDTLIANLRKLHQEILAYCNGEPLNVDGELEQIREVPL